MPGDLAAEIAEAATEIWVLPVSDMGFCRIGDGICSESGLWNTNVPAGLRLRLFLIGTGNAAAEKLDAGIVINLQSHSGTVTGNIHDGSDQPSGRHNFVVLLQCGEQFLPSPGFLLLWPHQNKVEEKSDQDHREKLDYRIDLRFHRSHLIPGQHGQIANIRQHLKKRHRIPPELNLIQSPALLIHKLADEPIFRPLPDFGKNAVS